MTRRRRRRRTSAHELFGVLDPHAADAEEQLQRELAHRELEELRQAGRKPKPGRQATLALRHAKLQSSREKQANLAAGRGARSDGALVVARLVERFDEDLVGRVTGLSVEEVGLLARDVLPALPGVANRLRVFDEVVGVLASRGLDDEGVIAWFGVARTRRGLTAADLIACGQFRRVYDDAAEAVPGVR